MFFYDLIVKDIKNVLYDTKTLALILIMPIVLMSILGASLQGVMGGMEDSGVAMARIGIVKGYDYEEQLYKVAGMIDLADYTDETIEGLDPQKNFFEMMDSEELASFLTYEIYTEEEGMAALENESIEGLVILPKDFIYNSYMLLEGSRLQSEITYKVNPDNDFFAGIIEGILKTYADMNNHIYAQQRAGIVTFLSNDRLEDLNLIAEMTDSYEDLETDGLVEASAIEGGKAVSSFQYYAAAIMCMFLLYSAGIGGTALLEERKEHTVPRLFVAGQSISLMVFSNYVRVMVLVMVQSGLMITYSTFVLGVDWGAIMNVLLTVVLSSVAVAALGMFVAVITLVSDNYKVANVFQFVIIYLMALLGGSFIPVEELPEGLRKLNFLSLNGQVLKMYLNSMYDLPLSKSLEPMMILLAFSLAFGSAAIILVKSRKGALAC